MHIQGNSIFLIIILDQRIQESGALGGGDGDLIFKGIKTNQKIIIWTCLTTFVVISLQQKREEL